MELLSYVKTRLGMTACIFFASVISLYFASPEIIKSKRPDAGQFDVKELSVNKLMVISLILAGIGYYALGYFSFSFADDRGVLRVQ
jgi:hypothetical protein